MTETENRIKVYPKPFPGPDGTMVELSRVVWRKETITPGPDGAFLVPSECFEHPGMNDMLEQRDR